MIYFDNAATSFQKPRCVYEAMIDGMINHSINAGRGGYDAAISSNEILFETKELLAKLFHIPKPERIAFTPNTTHALNMGIKGVLSYGDHAIFTSMEHNSVLRPMRAYEQQKRITTSVLRGNKYGELDLTMLEKMIRPNTKLICVTHSSNVCGAIYDINQAAEIAHKHNVYIMVDAAQSAGVVDIDASKLDLLAFPGHKGLMGPMGTGGLYVRDGLDLHTIIEGGTGSVSESALQPDMMPDRLESGTQNVPAIAALRQGVRYILDKGIKNIFTHEEMLCARFDNAMREIPNVTLYGTKNKTAISALNIDGMDCVTVAQILNDKYQIAVRAGLHCSILAHQTLGTKERGCVRFSFGYFNTQNEVDIAIHAISEIAKTAPAL